MNEQPTFERELLGAALYAPAVIDEWTVGPDDFADPKHKEIARTLLAMHAALELITPLTVHDAIAARGLGAAVPLPYVLELQSLHYAADPGPTRVYSGKVLEAAVGRFMRGEAGRIAHDLGLGTMSNAEAVEAFQRAAGQGLDRLTRQDRCTPMPTLVSAVWDEIERRTKTKDLVGLPTGFAELDERIGGIRPGVLSVIGGRTSTGKSAFARGIADNLTRAGHGVHFFSLEDNAAMLTERQLASQASVSLQALAHPNGKVSTEDMGRVAEAVNDLRKRRCWLVEDQPTMSSAAIAASVRRRKAEIGTRVVFVDYLQFVRDRGDTPRDRINASLFGLFKLAREENVAVVLLSQVGRDQEKESRPPRLSDLKESGAIEEQASLVLLLHHEQADPKAKKPAESMVLIAKNKHGERNIWVPLEWDGPTLSYRSRRVVGGHVL